MSKPAPMTDAFMQHVAATINARAVCSKNAKERGYGKGNGGSGQVVCPSCSGALRYTVSAYNGHMHGRCMKEGCVQWME
jgi:hypothetical protein